MAALGAGAQYGLILPYGAQPRDPGRQGGPDAGRGRLLQPAEAIPLWERMAQLGGGERPPEFASTHPDPGQPHPEPAGADAEGDGVPREVLQPGGRRDRRALSAKKTGRKARFFMREGCGGSETHEQPAVHRHVGAGDEAGIVGGQELDRARDLARLAEPADRHAFDDLARGCPRAPAITIAVSQ